MTVSLWQRVAAGSERLHHLMAETLTEPVEDEQQQSGRNQTHQDHAHPQLTNHQQVDPQRQRAEVHLRPKSYMGGHLGAVVNTHTPTLDIRGLTRHSAPSRQRGKLRDVHARHFCAGRLQGSESRLGGRNTPTTLSVLSESEDGDSSGSSMMVMTRQSEERCDASTPRTETAQGGHTRKWYEKKRRGHLSGCWDLAAPRPAPPAGRGPDTTEPPGCDGRPPSATPGDGQTDRQEVSGSYGRRSATNRRTVSPPHRGRESHGDRTDN